MRLNALVIDISLLGPRAWEYLSRVCEAVPGLGIVVCCEQSTVAQRVRGLRLGADDWVSKPCHPEEVIARVEAVVRRRKRASGPAESPHVVAGELEVRPDQFQAYVGGSTLELTRRQGQLAPCCEGHEVPGADLQLTHMNRITPGGGFHGRTAWRHPPQIRLRGRDRGVKKV